MSFLQTHIVCRKQYEFSTNAISKFVEMVKETQRARASAAFEPHLNQSGRLLLFMVLILL